MQIVTLNGLTLPGIDGHIDHFFPGSLSLERWNWRRRDVQCVMDDIEDDRYVVVGFSDGGSLAQRLASVDPRCKGLVVHSGMLWKPVPVVAREDSLTVLLLTTYDDRTPTYRSMHRMFEWAENESLDGNLFLDGLLEMEYLSGGPWWERMLRHQFRNGVDFIHDWLSVHFGVHYEIRTAVTSLQ